MKTYFENNILETLLKIEIPFIKLFKGFKKGSHRSNITGRNIDFKDHREYVQGDDISNLDWKLFARTEKLYIKEYEEDISCNILVIIDKSGSMNFTSSDLNKLEYAKYIFSIIFFMFTRQGDSVGLGVFDDKFNLLIPFTSRNDDLLRIDNLLLNLSAKGNTNIEKILINEKYLLSDKINIIFVISDMISNLDKINEFIRNTKKIENEIFLFHLVDPYEEIFQFKGENIYCDFESDKQIVLDSEIIKPLYQKYFENHFNKIKNYARQIGCYYFKIDTSLPYSQNFLECVNHFTEG